MAGEGVAQHMGRQASRIEAGLDRKRLEELRAALARQMPGRAARGKEIARFRLGLERRGPRREPGIERRAGRPRQADQFRYAQAGAVEQLQETDQPRPVRALSRARRRKQRRRFVLAEDFRQRATEPRRVELGRRIVFADALQYQEAEELAQRRQFARGAARRDALARQMGEIGAQLVAGRRVERAVFLEPRRCEEVVAIGGDGQPRRAALGRQHFKKRLEMARFGCHSPLATASSRAMARASASKPASRSADRTRSATIGSVLRPPFSCKTASAARIVSPRRCPAAARCNASHEAALGIADWRGSAICAANSDAAGPGPYALIRTKNMPMARLESVERNSSAASASPAAFSSGRAPSTIPNSVASGIGPAISGRNGAASAIRSAAISARTNSGAMSLVASPGPSATMTGAASRAAAK